MGADADTVVLDEVEVLLDGPWATPKVRAALRSGSYERAERGILTATLSPDDSYLELGCGIGVLATLAATRVGGESVVAIDADPSISTVARDTASRNGHAIDVRNAVLLRELAGTTVDFYVRPDFRLSSLDPSPTRKEAETRVADMQKVSVPVVDPYETIADVNASYLMVDIEGGELDLLSQPLPESVRTICVELHLEATEVGARSEMFAAVMDAGFELDFRRSDPPVLLFTR